MLRSNSKKAPTAYKTEQCFTSLMEIRSYNRSDHRYNSYLRYIAWLVLSWNREEYEFSPVHNQHMFAARHSGQKQRKPEYNHDLPEDCESGPDNSCRHLRDVFSYSILEE